ncbi:amidohydrolase family protein [Sphingosinicella microcystinivorans]|uniref:amidohydrolase family protein n=1 Tax=Sphingosinicella microcystinivorans TaxID=335406 RepID=UPI0022F3CD49|nr:amidohydrolase family protein [Sphingosinicella microcystinivorans]WBX84158.1 amidohydrolase family protein [Sphingosinicella microcystinivorans]
MKRSGRYSFFALCTWLAIAATPAAAESKTSATPLLIRNATLVDGTGDAPKSGIDILVVNGKIASVGPKLAAPARTKIVDATGKFVTPGLIDAHVHLHFPTLFQLTEDERAKVIAHTPKAFLYNGVTTILNVSSPKDWIIAQRQAQRDGRLVAPRIYALGHSFTPEKGWGSRHGGALSDAAAARAKAEEYVASNLDGFKIVIEDGLGSHGTHVEMPEDMLFAIVDVAKANAMKMYVHAMNLHEFKRAVAIKAQSVIHGLEDPLPEGDSLIADMVNNNVAIVHTASLFRSFLGPDPRVGANLDDPVLVGSVPAFMLAKMRSVAFMDEEKALFSKASMMDAYAWAREHNPNICENIGKMHRGGVKTAVGTDAGGTVGYNFQGYNTPWEVKILTECGLTPMEALVAATRNGAEVIGVADTLGTVEPGKIADMLILSADPLQNIENIRAIEWIVQDGKLHPRNEFAYRP